MSKTIFYFFLAVIFSATAAAQQTEGHVSYTMEFSSKAPEMQMQLGMLQGSKMELYFTEGKSRTEVKIGTLIQTTVITDAKKSEMVTLMSGIMGNHAVNQSIEKPVADTKAPQIVEILNETKEIAGYLCTKAIIRDEEGNKYTYWFTDKIKVASEGQKYFDGKGIPGFPLQMEFAQNGMDIKLTANLFENLPKKHKYFDMRIPEGYKEITKEEMGKMMGGLK